MRCRFPTALDRGAPEPQPVPRRGQEGLTLLEVMIALVVVAVSAVTALGLMVGSMRLDAANRESNQAVSAARNVVQQMQGTEFSDMFAAYNETTQDDPPGVASPGSNFSVGGFVGSEGQASGSIVFPVAPNGELREDLEMPELGLPMDLNGDGVIDNLDHSQDYQVLPVRVELQWTGPTGPRQVAFHSVFSEGGP